MSEEFISKLPTRREAIASLLKLKTHPDLAGLYNPEMEVQVNVAPDGGEAIQGDYNGHAWKGWTDGFSKWKHFRIPHGTKTEPIYESPEPRMTFDIEMHAESVGLTGWNWVQKKSYWVGFDFDAITGHSDNHSKKLTQEQLDEIKDAVSNVDWVTVRTSSSGSGLHIYVFLPGIDTANHNEHAALARAVLGHLSAVTGYNLLAKVDVCGAMMWIWHRKMYKGGQKVGLALIKKGSVLTDVLNWQDHICVVNGDKPRRRVRAGNFDSESRVGAVQELEDFTSQRSFVALDEDHKKLISYLTEHELAWEWDTDRQMLISHTHHLRDAHKALMMKGVFKTDSRGSSEKNCFLFPAKDGAWEVRRYTPGVNEANTWLQDKNGWTWCYYNRVPDFKICARACGGVEVAGPGSRFKFQRAEMLREAMNMYGDNTNIPVEASEQEAEVTIKNGRLSIVIASPSVRNDLAFKGWWYDKKKDQWTKLSDSVVESTEADAPDVDILRHIVTEQDMDAGWLIQSGNSWRNEPLVHVKALLKYNGYDNNEVERIIGRSIDECWTLVTRPFEAEYPGNRLWNRYAPQLRYKPDEGDNLRCPTWDLILNHIGSSLDPFIKADAWCKLNGVQNGGDYLKAWLHIVLTRPTEHLPYLFLYSREQHTGKTTFHEAIDLLITRGVERAENALVHPAGFNLELVGCLVAVIEEMDMNINKTVANRIKDWVTGETLPIHPKFGTPYRVRNMTHWIHCANEATACPIFPNDTRITMIQLRELPATGIIEKQELKRRCIKEAPAFLGMIKSMEIISEGRLAIPVIETAIKKTVANINAGEIESFISNNLFSKSGHCVKFSDAFDSFTKDMSPKDADSWTARAFSSELRKAGITVGRSSKDSQTFLINCTMDKLSKAKEHIMPMASGLYRIPEPGDE
jgi:hypothetical protein